MQQRRDQLIGILWRLVPPGLPEEHQTRSLGLVVTCLTSSAICFVSLLLAELDLMLVIVPPTVVIGIGMLGVVSIMWATQRYTLAVVVFLVLGAVGIVLAALPVGGLASDNVFWLVLLPAIAQALLEKRGTLIGLLILGAGVGGIWAGEQLGWSSPPLSAEVSAGFRIQTLVWIAVFGAVISAAREIALGRVRRALSDEARARSDAEARTEATARFLASVSHEIRTPLNGILGLAAVLSESPLAPQQREHVSTIHRSGELLMRLLNDVLDTARLEAGAMSLSFQPVDPAQLIEEVLALLRGDAMQRGLWLRHRCDAPLPEAVQIDPGRIQQIVLNLVGNALKFTTSGGIEVHQRWAEGRWQITVSDTGIGIPSERLDAIFSPFVQARDDTHQHYGGTGLGLSICRQLAEAHGGSLTVRSTLGEGSAFTLEVSAEPCALPAPVSAAADRAPPLRVLVAEDNAINQRIARLLLEGDGHSVTIVGDGVAAVQAAGEGFDLILMDLSMPRLDGVAATQRIHAELPQHPPIVALTANAFPEDRARILAAGAVGFLAKPIDRSALRQVLLEAAAAAA